MRVTSGKKDVCDRQVRRLRIFRLPERQLLAGLFQDPQTDRHHHARGFGDGDEFVRRNDAVFGTIPAQQQLEALDHAIQHANLGLVDQCQFVAFQREAQGDVHLRALGAGVLQRSVEHFDAVASALLGLIGGGVGIAD